MTILIVGHPGSGKTYLANVLEKKTGTEKIDIDILFDKHPFYAFSKHLYKMALNKLLDGEANWIIDGYHVGLMPDELVEQAMVVIYLNLPKNELKQNVISRYKSAKDNGEFSHWQSTRINNLKNFLQIRFLDNALQKDVNRIKNLISGNGNFIELKSREDTDRFLSTFPE